MSKPDNCKFCGSEGAFRFYCEGGEKWGFVICLTCNAQTAHFLSEESALAAWNRKPEPEPITPEGLERLGFVKSVDTFGKTMFFTEGDNGRRVIVGFLKKHPMVFVNSIPHVSIMCDIQDLMRIFL